MARQEPPEHGDAALAGQARKVVEEYANDQREIIRKLRKSMKKVSVTLDLPDHGTADRGDFLAALVEAKDAADQRGDRPASLAIARLIFIIAAGHEPLFQGD